MKANDIREMTAGDLAAKITELEEERFRLTFRSGTEALENPLRLRFIRRDIARLKTIQNEQANGIVRVSAKPAAKAAKAPAKATTTRAAKKSVKGAKTNG